MPHQANSNDHCVSFEGSEEFYVNVRDIHSQRNAVAINLCGYDGILDKTNLIHRRYRFLSYSGVFVNAMPVVVVVHHLKLLWLGALAAVLITGRADGTYSGWCRRLLNIFRKPFFYFLSCKIYSKKCFNWFPSIMSFRIHENSFVEYSCTLIANRLHSARSACSQTVYQWVLHEIKISHTGLTNDTN